MIQHFLVSFRDKFGPGFLFAASAVGTSHLVQSTRAGADFGFALVGVTILACLVKYPVFRFGAEYAAATGRTLVDNYEHQGKWVLIVYALALPLDLVIAPAAVSLVSAGIVIHVFKVSLNVIVVSSLIMGACALLLLLGKYRLFEKVTKIFVILFTLLVIIASALVLPEISWASDNLVRPLTFSRPENLFIIALAGWMPTGINAAVFQSIWVCEKARVLKRRIPTREACLDFNVGYFSSLFLALCFTLLGTALLFTRDIPVAGSASGFAAQLIDIFTTVIGNWSFPIIAVATLFVMISTVLTLLDAGPRAIATLANRIGVSKNPDADQVSVKQYFLFMLLQMSSAVLFLYIFLSSFKAFIDLATSVAFLSAPVIAFFNHRAMFHSDVPVDQQPSALMKTWSIVGIIVLASFAFWFLSMKLY